MLVDRVRSIAIAAAAVGLVFTSACGAEVDGGKVTVCADAQKALTEFGDRIADAKGNLPKVEKEARKLGNRLKKLANETGDKTIKEALTDMASSWQNFDPKDAGKAAAKITEQAGKLAITCA